MKKLLLVFTLCLLFIFSLTACNKEENQNQTNGEHVHTPGLSVIENKIPATCTTDGSYDLVIYCTGCGVKMIWTTNTEKALGHDLEHHAGKFTTCNEPSWEAYDTCTRCDYSTYTEIPAGHNYVNLECSVCGYKLTPSEGLKFTSNGDGTCYVSGMGNCTDTDVVIPLTSPNGDRVVGIGRSAFMGQQNITGVIITDNVKYIAYSAFVFCYNLESIVLGNNLESIDELAFGGTKIRELVIPASLTSIDATVTALLDKIAVHGNNPNYKIMDGNLYSKDGKTLIRYAAGKADTSFVIPDGVTSIGERALYDCDNLTSVLIPDGVISIGDYAFCENDGLVSVTIGKGVTNIGDYAFCGCDSLTSIVIPGNVKSICKEAFFDCNSLASVTIGNGVTGIGDRAFAYCDNLTIVMIGDSVISIGRAAFDDCTVLASITVDKNNPYYKSVDGNIYSKDGKLLVIYAPGKNETSFVIPDGVTSIGESAFYSCDSLTSVEIPDSVTAIGEWVFYGCTSLTSIVIPHSVTSIGDFAFSSCDSLTSIIIGNGVTSIGDFAFSYCYKLVEVYNLSDLNIEKGSEDNGEIGHYAIDIYTSRSEDSKVFENSDGFIFYENGDICYLLGYVGDNTVITLPGSCNGKNYAIYQYAFYECEILTSVVIPDGVTSIGNSAFYSCDSLTSVTIGNSVTSIGDYAFSYCSVLTSIIIGNGVTSIGNHAFNYCTFLTSIVIPDSVTSIGDDAFYNCESLTSIIIGNGVTNIGSHAFYYCAFLTSIVIPDSVTSIGNFAFYNCESLTDVYYKGSEENFANITISGGNEALTSSTIHYNYKG